MGTRGRQTKASQEKRSREEESELWRALEAGLLEILPGLKVLDRDLVFDEGGRVDLAAVDPAGRLFLVLLAEDLDRTPLQALDALSFARRHTALFANHFRQRVAVELEPKLLVVTPTVDDRLTLRLAPLIGHGLELYGVRTLASRSGERSYLVPLLPPPTSPDEGRLPGEQAFLEALSPDTRELARLVLERIDRLDDELELAANRDTLSWRFRGEVLVRVERAGELMRASVSPHAESLPLVEEAALETLLEKALGRLVELLGRDGAGVAPVEEAPPAGGRVTPRELLEEEGPLLTPEEIEAFRAD